MCNRDPGASLHGLDLNAHTGAHVLRSAQEGIVFALRYGLEIMRDIGMEVRTIRAGTGNMFRSRLFGEAFAASTGAVLELYDTEGSQGAARGAGLGAGLYAGSGEAFAGLGAAEIIEPETELVAVYTEAYERWCRALASYMG